MHDRKLDASSIDGIRRLALQTVGHLDQDLVRPLVECNHPIVNPGTKAWYCNSSACPMCRWRRTREKSVRLTDTLAGVRQEYPSSSFLFLTGTVGEYQTSYLRQTIKTVLRKWNTHVRKLAVFSRNLILGWYRSLEIVGSARHADLEFPHIHAVVAYPRKLTGRHYWSKSKWSAAWQEIYPGGNLDVQQIGPTEADIIGVSRYIHKARADQFYNAARVMIEDPERYLERYRQLKGLHMFSASDGFLFTNGREGYKSLDVTTRAA